MTQADSPETVTKSPPKNTKQSHPRLALFLFLLSLLVYLSTRFVRLPDFPIYFFTDEAIRG